MHDKKLSRRGMHMMLYLITQPVLIHVWFDLLTLGWLHGTGWNAGLLPANFLCPALNGQPAADR